MNSVTPNQALAFDESDRCFSMNIDRAKVGKMNACTACVLLIILQATRSKPRPLRHAA